METKKKSEQIFTKIYYLNIKLFKHVLKIVFY